ncbi:uncharacterized protein H6S33_005290 [Morchella sextelata]|uniref:uncharacterized protein n=1 Tax=Morchella sextelata TaxID=1174677 RepID=UPI001D049481|nr:uncharacterized protein H6S33_005290 [Morchella sextelata]KAH0613404.1 hypothetical protein H6S33_005290 [Morchella sextelata]
MNNERHSSTKKTPYQIMFKQQMEYHGTLVLERSEIEIEYEVEALVVKKNRKRCRLFILRIKDLGIRFLTPTRFEKGDTVAVKIPRKHRNATDPSRFFCIIRHKPHPDRYQLQCKYGILREYYPTREMEVVPPTFDNGINADTPTTLITLAAAFRRSISDSVNPPTAATRCDCRRVCNTRYCACFKQNEPCSAGCYYTKAGGKSPCKNPFKIHENVEEEVAEEEGEEDDGEEEDGEENEAMDDVIEDTMLTLEENIRSRIESPKFRELISYLIVNYRSNPLIQNFRNRRPARISGRRVNVVREDIESQMKTLPGGYYTQARSSLGALVFEDFGSNHRQNLEAAMILGGDNKALSYAICTEVITPAIIVEFIKEDMNIQNEDAWALLKNKSAVEYGEFSAYEEIYQDMQVRKNRGRHS